MTSSAAGPAALSPDPRAAKAALRTRLLAARRARDPQQRAAAGAALAAGALGAADRLGAGTVAAYASTGGEPPTDRLLAELLARGTRVLLPVLLPDDDLDWAPYDGTWALGRRGLREPTGPLLGAGALTGVPLVVVPALAVGRDGTRLGRGGGSYDRALARAPRAHVLALLWEDELLDEVPSEAHDRRVDAVLTPAGARTRAPGSG